MAKKLNIVESGENVEKALSATELFLQKNKKSITLSLGALASIVLLFVAIQMLYRAPRKEEALAQLYPAEEAFNSGNFQVALEGDGNNLGFAQIIKEYPTTSPHSIYLYAGASHLQLGNYQEAIDILKKYKSKEPVLQARALAGIGDAYVALSDYKSALSYFHKAASFSQNDYVAGYLMKAAIVHEELKEYKSALALYKKIKEKYSKTVEGADIDKYIARAEMLLK
ncbi:MAG: tetratricopeptide repeat protein [Bacteroidales bacterium]